MFCEISLMRDDQKPKTRRDIKGIFLFITLFGAGVGIGPFFGLEAKALILAWGFFVLISLGLVRFFHKKGDDYGDQRFVQTAIALVMLEVACIWIGIVYLYMTGAR